MHGEYWAALEREGFHAAELPLPQLLGLDLDLVLGPHSREPTEGSKEMGTLSHSSSEAEVDGSEGTGVRLRQHCWCKWWQ